MNFYHFILLHVYFDLVKVKCSYIATGLYDFEHKKNYPFGPQQNKTTGLDNL